ncbi:hypothetical protein EYF80_023690 [Liparis tanakae]|uniref:Uncharacterized protein n=1 Tax=Liparis tanakae TaxID=230148 RepID=A0A4Z2HMP8_9TELE|nr:hypothetical protein EYF80_023690 [Liparis tanakae]
MKRHPLSNIEILGATEDVLCTGRGMRLQTDEKQTSLHALLAPHIPSLHRRDSLLARAPAASFYLHSSMLHPSCSICSRGPRVCQKSAADLRSLHSKH